MMDQLEGSMLTRCKLPLWLGLLLLLAVVGLLVPLIYFAVRANSKACVDGLQAQECQEHNRHLQRQLDQASREKEAEAATCNRTVVTLRESLKKEQAQVAKFQGELKILNQTLKDALADVERLRRQNENSSESNASSCSSFLFVVIAVLVLNAPLT
ncbi:bone marrow stromal antigen 2-like [Budorcas taxicolor]|uniref:bone marrow stromal antigen 2-like n=1 Tax=Budorcas taxicolor TaxID=37181 RepID=UPI0022851125|nr:bone marrow stromal antigen 2-like [Budorcas taxicolor]